MGLTTVQRYCAACDIAEKNAAATSYFILLQHLSAKRAINFVDVVHDFSETNYLRIY